ncbi:hypothetical protein [Bartonella harrusi]|nr:hypothetical protein [Bartonella harrusi]
MNEILAIVCRILDSHYAKPLLAIQLTFVRKEWKIFQERVRVGQFTKALDKALKRMVEDCDLHERLRFQVAPPLWKKRLPFGKGESLGGFLLLFDILQLLLCLVDREI